MSTKHDVAIEGMSCGHCAAAVKGALEARFVVVVGRSFPDQFKGPTVVDANLHHGEKDCRPAVAVT